MERVTTGRNAGLGMVTCRILPLLLALSGCGGEGGPVTPPGGAAQLVVASGGDQRGLGGRPVAEPLVVRALDGNGRPAAGITVSFAPADGNGSVDPISVSSAADGTAQTMWTLGSAPGRQTLSASAGSATVTARAEALDLDAELEQLFAVARDEEIRAVRNDWAERDVSPTRAIVEHAGQLQLDAASATVRIVSHRVGEVRHFGAIIVPDGASPQSLHLLVYAHGGDSGVSVDSDLGQVALVLGELSSRFVYVIPSFRSEPLGYDGRAWISEGPGGHWDRDVDDLLSLVTVAFEMTPEAQPGRFSVIGFSRGGGVALLAGIRDPRVERIVSFFGPTDFFDPWIRVIVRKAAFDGPWDLPGLIHLDSTVIKPLVRGEMTIPEARLEMVRRSSVLFAADLPPVQVHHGIDDFVVPVSQARSMRRALDALGRAGPDYEVFEYPGGHSILQLAAAVPRAVAFLSNVLPPP